MNDSMIAICSSMKGAGNEHWTGTIFRAFRPRPWTWESVYGRKANQPTIFTRRQAESQRRDSRAKVDGDMRQKTACLNPTVSLCNRSRRENSLVTRVIKIIPIENPSVGIVITFAMPTLFPQYFNPLPLLAPVLVLVVYDHFYYIPLPLFVFVIDHQSSAPTTALLQPSSRSWRPCPSPLPPAATTISLARLRRPPTSLPCAYSSHTRRRAGNRGSLWVRAAGVGLHRDRARDPPRESAPRGICWRGFRRVRARWAGKRRWRCGSSKGCKLPAGRREEVCSLEGRKNETGHLHCLGRWSVGFDTFF